MKTLALMLAVSLAPLTAAPLAQGDRDFALSSLHASSKMFVDSIAGLTPAQWNFKPAPDRWSIAEVAEHIVLSEDGIRDWLKKTLATPAVSPASEARTRDQALLKKLTDRSEATRAQAPKTLVPSGAKFKTPQAAIDAFKTKREATLDYTRTTQDELRSHVTGSGDNQMDAYQLLLLIGGHTERHVAQIDEVKAAPNYPK